MIFVISGLVNPSQLVCCSRKEFLAVKKKLRILDNITSPKKGSWYHTADSIEKNALDPADREARKRAFVRMVLERAKLR